MITSDFTCKALITSDFTCKALTDNGYLLKPVGHFFWKGMTFSMLEKGSISREPENSR